MSSSKTELHLPARHAEPKHTQNGRAKKGAAICRSCMHIFYQKQWVHPKFASHKVLEEANKSKHVMLCPACLMSEQHLYEGEVLIHQVPEHYEKELVNLINAYGRRAVVQDSQHRVIAVEKKGLSYRVTTTENQLAAKLAKKIKEVFKGISDLRILHSKAPYAVERAVLIFA